MPNGKGLCRRAKVDRLWRVWYALLILAVHGFLLHASFQRYSAFRSRALREQWPMGPMNFHLAGAIAAALMLPLFLYSAFLKTDNFAEDGVQVGRDRDSLRVAAVDVAEGVVGCGACLSRLLRHFVPYTSALHLLMSLCLLLPMPVLEAEEIHREQLAKDQIWRTDLDFVIQPTATATHPVSTEVFNLLLALAILTVRYPSVFWFSNRVFSLLFSVVVCASGLHTFLAYEATSVLYKAATVGSTESVVLKIPPAATLALDSVGSMLLLLASGAFFEFGYAQVLNNLRKYRHYLQLEASSSGSSERSNGSSGAGVGSIDGAACCASNANLIFGLLLMLAAALCKAPVLWDWLSLYHSRQEPILLAAAVSAGACLLIWIAAWLALCCRPVWQFNIRLELEFPEKVSADYQGQRQQPGQPSSASMPQERRSPPSSAGSDLSKKSNQYVFMHRGISSDMQPVSMIPTVSEQVDNASESSYTCGGANGTLDRQAGLVKYQVRRNSAQLSSAAASGSLKRNALLARSRSGNRVTFKDRHETIPGSPGSSQNTSSDSGIEASRLNGQQQQQQGSVVTSLQIGLNDDYARVNKQPRAPSRQSNYEDYPMLGCLFGNQSDMSASAGGPAEFYQHQQTDPYGRPLPGVPVLPPPPAGYGTGASAAAMGGDPYGVPDILLSRSPFASLSRQPAAAKQDHYDYYELQQQQQQQHLRSGSYPSLPQPMQPGDQLEGLCSQV
ncbi:hypothetical protein BOX15_Mlig020687g1 [Macrostomum lignano]|uniref:Uncharacterized protein n=1 Tax=Macrostomum lignano TaxID=282301 RepID=A0A267F2I5_9PLAT|nr:hypothetical protein BOX15_Mlig020687g1 [Macrostomum lignano]